MISGSAISIGGFIYTPEALSASFVCKQCGAQLVNKRSEGVTYTYCSADKNHKGIRKEEIEMDMGTKENGSVVITTLTGFTLEQIAKIFDEELEKEAYKPVPGVLDFTDVLPAWHDEYFNRVFGVAGFGWWYDYDITPDNLTQSVTTVKNKTMYIAEIKKVSLYFRMVVNGEIVVAGPIPSSGYSENYFNPGDALKGAVTAAMGKASSRMGWQLAVYKGQRGHANVTGDGSTGAQLEMDLEEAALFPTHRPALIKLAVSGESMAPAAQRLLLGMMDRNAGVTTMRADLGEDVAKAIRVSFSALYKRSGLTESANEFCSALIGKTMEELTYGEFLSLWDSVAEISAKLSTRDNLVRMYEALRTSS
jgi:hypothetical protein